MLNRAEFDRGRWRLFLLGLFLMFPQIDVLAQENGKPRAGEEETEEQITREMERISRLMKEDPFKLLGERAIRKIEAEYGQGFFTFFFDDGVIPRPDLVAVQLRKNVDPDKVSSEFGQILGNLHLEFDREYGGLPEMEEIKRPVVVFVFESESKSVEFAIDNPEIGLIYFPGLGGYFNTVTEILYTWDKPDHWEVLFHEGTHQLMHHASKKWNASPLATWGSRSNTFLDHPTGRSLNELYYP